jgi:hypothetical protein
MSDSMQTAYETGLVVIGTVILLALVFFLWSLSPKVLGFIMILFSLFTLRYLPRMGKYQIRQFTRTGFVIAFIIMAFGLLFVIFL